MTDKYILEGRQAVPCDDLMQWARWFANGTARRVARDSVRGINVSTVFLGIDHSFGEGPPQLFETKTFGEGFDQEQERYATWDEAVAGHAAMVERVKAARPSNVECPVPLCAACGRPLSEHSKAHCPRDMGGFRDDETFT